MPKYEVVTHSVSAHCCFSATIIDNDLKDDEKGIDGNIGEFFSEEVARIICSLLNDTIAKKHIGIN